MALATYTDLQASVSAWLHRSDLTALIPDFVALAESRIARDLRIRRQVVTVPISTVANNQAIALPTGFLEIENITISSTSPATTLSVVTPEILDRLYPDGYNPGQPVVYTLLGDTILLGPTPNAIYTVSLDYYKRLDALSVTPTNWLLTNYPAVYLASTLVEAALYTQDEAAVATWDARYQAEVGGVQKQDDAALRSGSLMRVRAM
jgi:hypothetical protein